MFSDNSIFFLILDNINHFANSAAHIHEVHFYFRCPNALSEKLGAAEKLEVTPSTDLLSHYIVIYKQGSRIFGSGFFAKNPGALVAAPTKIENLTGTNILLNTGVSTTFTITGNPFNLTENLYYVVGNATWTAGASPNDSTLGLPLLAKFNGSDTEIINYKHPSLVTYNTFNIEFVAE